MSRTSPEPRRRPVPWLLALLPFVAACGDGEPPAADAPEPEEPGVTAEAALGPHDARDLPPVDLDRVGVGDTAPDFTLASYEGGPVTLSDFRGERDVILVFYRGHW